MSFKRDRRNKAGEVVWAKRITIEKKTKFQGMQKTWWLLDDQERLVELI